MEKIDKIFKEKLEQYERPVSEAAWNKIAGGLERKKQVGFYFYLRIAAGFTLLAIAAAYLLLKNDRTESVLETQAIANVGAAEEKTEAVALEQIETPDLNEVSDTPLMYTRPKKSNNTLALKSQDRVELKEIEKEIIPIEQPEEITSTEVAQLIRDTPVSIKNETNSNDFLGKPISLNIILTGNATESNAIASTEYQEDKKDGLGEKMKKLFNKAQELKHSEGALADLRQAKDEILAFDFKKESLK